MREKVSQDIREQLQKRAVEFGLILEDISITDLHFSREFAASIEEKQVAQQKAERAKFVVQRMQEETQARIIRAEGDAEAATLIAASIQKYGPGLVAMRKIEAANYMVEKLHQNPNITFLQSGSTLNMLNINK